MTKKDIYNKYGIEYKAGKIYHSEFGWIAPLLVDGNTKLGKGVWTFSTLPTNRIYHVTINDKEYEIMGTCPCHCNGCYATKGNYNFSNVIIALAIRTWLCYNDMPFVCNAIMAQIAAENIKLFRIHASGDFFSEEYINMWKYIVSNNQNCVFWTYTKNAKAESAFDNFSNANIVKSIISGFGFNYGHCDYILSVYKALKEMGKSVYICRCGIDKNQHCTNCKGCSEHEIVLFVEHSTAYKAEEDHCYDELKRVIESQRKA